MTKVGVAQLKTSLSAYLTRVKAGEVVTVTEHGRPIAELRPLSRDQTGDQAYLAKLEREGLIRMGTGEIPDEFWEMEIPDDPDGLALAYLLEERAEGR
jgi:prevent-host-death family protein